MATKIKFSDELVGDVQLVSETTTLRDRMAIAALPVVGNGVIQMSRTDRERIARAAYALADEMLKARDISQAQLKDLVR